MFSHGFGSRTQNGFEIAELASHGYIIASVEHSWNSVGTRFPDGTIANIDPKAGFVLTTDSTSVRVVNIWAADGRFVIDRMFDLDRADPRQMLAGLDRHHEGRLFRHSFGGATAAQVMLDARVLAGINMDGYLAGRHANGLDRPFLQFRSELIDIEAVPADQLAAMGTSRRRAARHHQVRTSGPSR